ncbi:putative ribonuclease H-like domain-containing protein [Tanacetum coccineum]
MKEVFAPVARIEAIRLFLAYASFKDFVVFQMDVKSAFLYGKIEEEVYVCQPPGFEDPDFPDRVYKVEKALYGLHQAPKAWYETLSTYLLDNEFQRGKIDKTLFIKRNKEVKTASTPMKTQKPLLKDENGEEVDAHMYRSMISSLMYLTASRPDIMFVVCACTRYQVNPKVSNLHAVKRIFRDGENLDKMKEKGDPCVMVGYSTQSKGYRVYNKRTRLIVESIHIKFDEIKEMMSDHNSSDLAPQRQEIQNVVPPAEKTDSSQQGLEFLFSPLLEEYYNPTHGQAEENNNDQAPNASFQEDEFINPFCTRVQEIGESSSRNIDNTDMHSFQPQSHDYRWTRDHPLEQVRGNPTMPVQTRAAIKSSRARA